MRLKGKSVGVFIEEGFEDLEFWVTVMRLREEGATVQQVKTKSGARLTPKRSATCYLALINPLARCRGGMGSSSAPGFHRAARP